METIRLTYLIVVSKEIFLRHYKHVGQFLELVLYLSIFVNSPHFLCPNRLHGIIITADTSCVYQYITLENTFVNRIFLWGD